MKKKLFFLFITFITLLFLKSSTEVLAKLSSGDGPVSSKSSEDGSTSAKHSEDGLTYEFIPIENYHMGSIKKKLPTLAFTKKSSFTPTHTPKKVILPDPTEAPTPIPTDLPPTPTAIPVPTIDPNSDSIWDSLAQCEAGGNWNTDTGNGYFGGLQFTQGAWESVGGSGSPAQASREDQIAKGKLLQQRRGWGAWGACARKLGL